MIIMGLSAFYHDAACCLLRDGRLVAAASEERFSRVKNDPRLPLRAFRACLDQAGCTVADIDVLAYYEDPVKKLARQLYAGHVAEPVPDPRRPLDLIRTRTGFEGPIVCYDHHASHAASSYYFSGFDRAAVLTVDGVGEWATTSYGLGEGASLRLLEQVDFPHSMGLFYATLTAYLGFKVNSGEYKVMGLAPYGKPRYVAQLRRLIASTEGGGFRLDGRYFDFVSGGRMYSDALIDLLGRPPRAPESALDGFHHDVARSLQLVLEELLLEKVTYLHTLTGADALCMAGGVALNCVANGRIHRESPFPHLFVQPAAGDAGAALGAAALAHAAHTGKGPAPLAHAYLGPAYAPEELAAVLADCGIAAEDYRGREAALLEATVDLLALHAVVGWFQGAMEFGPRALGARSILANPTDPSIRDRLNEMVKKREAFRPFAPSVALAAAPAHFDLPHASPYMLETCRVASSLDLPGITHVDGSARPQTVDPTDHPRYAALLAAFARRTGCPLLVNTSFNVRGEPIVASPTDALRCAQHADLDALVLGDFLVRKAQLPALWSYLMPQGVMPHQDTGGRISEHLYTFV